MVERIGVLLLLAIGLSSCASNMRRLPPLPPGERAIFRDVTKRSGIDFEFQTDEVKAKVIASMGGGVALADYDDDGDLDVAYSSSVPHYGEPNLDACSRLYENLGDGRFRNVVKEAGIEDCGWGNGVFWLDIDSDGRDDLYFTGFEHNRVLRNETEPGGRPRFRDVTERLGLGNGVFSVGVNLVDYDRDGLPDVYVANYLSTTLESEAATKLDDLRVPEDYDALPNKLWHNEGFAEDGLPRYRDVTAETGAENPGGKSLAVGVLDWNRDGWPDLFIANDRTPNALLTNQGASGRIGFVDTAEESGVAFNSFGKHPSGMGVAAGDLDSDGWADVFVTNFANEWNNLYFNIEGATFEDATERSGLGPPSYSKVGWGTVFFDYDNDGQDDIAVMNGGLVHDFFLAMMVMFGPEAKSQQYAIGDAYHQHALLFHNECDLETAGHLHFRDVTDLSGDFGRPLMVARGVTAGDLDRDGDLELLTVDQTGPARVFENLVGADKSWIEIELKPGPDRRTVYGSRITLTMGDWDETREWYVQPSYASGSAVPIHIGLGDGALVDRLEIEWPDGSREVHENLPARKWYRFVKGGSAPIVR